jgi:hypothetical protein
MNLAQNCAMPPNINITISRAAARSADNGRARR